MSREEIDEIVCKILRHDGLDRHVDGHDVITDFIMALLERRGPTWAWDYERKIEERRRWP